MKYVLLFLLVVPSLYGMKKLRRVKRCDNIKALLIIDTALATKEKATKELPQPKENNPKK